MPKAAVTVEWHEGSKRIRISVGKDAAVANARRLRKEAELRALNNGVTVIAEDTRNWKHQRISDAVVSYLAEIKISRSAATHSAYALALRNFTESCEKQYLEEIDRLDLLEYVRYMREDLRLADRTCHNRFEHVLTFLKANGIEKLATKRDWPKYVQKEPEIYTEEELEKFFNVCDAAEKVCFEFFLMTGFRKKEVIQT